MFSTTSGSILSSASGVPGTPGRGEHGFLPGRLQPLQVQLGQFQELAPRRERTAGEQSMDVRVPVQEFAERLNGGDHAGLHVVATEQTPDFRLEARPDAGAQLAQQLAIEAAMQPQTLGDGQHDLPVGDRRADLFGHVDRGQQRPCKHGARFLVAGGTGAALLAGKGHEHLVVAVRAADAGEALVQIAALEKGRHRAFDDRAPEAILGRKPLVIDLLEGLEMLVQQPPQVGGLRVAGAAQREGLDARDGHDRKGTGPGMVYTPSLEHMYTSGQADARSPHWKCPRGGHLRRDECSSAALATVENLSAGMADRLRGP
jgi:hypothetical protein